MKVFLASASEARKPLTAEGRRHLDLGKGLYLATSHGEAIDWSSCLGTDEKQVLVSAYEFDIDAARKVFSVRIFPSLDSEWLSFVTACREGLPAQEKYDAVLGGVVNGRIFNAIELLAAGCISRKEALSRLSSEQPGTLICVRSEELADRCLKFVASERVAVDSEPVEPANPTLLQMKMSRVITLLAKTLGVGILEAMDLFYRSGTYQELADSRSRLRNRSDLFIVDELAQELERKD